MEVAVSLGALCTSQTTWHQIPEDCNFHVFKDSINLQDRQYTCNIALWHMHIAVVPQKCKMSSLCIVELHMSLSTIYNIESVAMEMQLEFSFVLLFNYSVTVSNIHVLGLHVKCLLLLTNLNQI
jgi:hypothetical protein